MSEASLPPPLKDSAGRVQQALAVAGFAFQVREFPASTRTSVEAAAANGCAVAQIAKSLIFRGRETGRAVLVMASGANRVQIGREHVCTPATSAHHVCSLLLEK